MSLLADIALPDRDRRDEHPSRRHFTATRMQLEDAVLTGLTYALDGRAEEEFGMGELREALTGADDRNFAVTTDGYAHHVRVFADVNAIALSSRPLPDGQPSWGQVPELWSNVWVDGREACRGDAGYAHFFEAEQHAELWSDRIRLERQRVDQLRTTAKNAGISPLPRRKADLVNQLLADIAAQRGPTMDWPGWFHFGQMLVLRADDGPTAQVLEGLIDAINARTLVVADGSQVFSPGLFLYDGRDETDQLRAARDEMYDWLEVQERDVAPVRDELKGHYNVHFLGGPTVQPDRFGDHATRWWVNISPPYRGQPETVRGRQLPRQTFGYYTRAELLDRRFIEVALERERERAAS